MANWAKYSRGDCGALLAHCERYKNAEGEYIKFHNIDIDTSRIHINYNLAPECSESQRQFLN